MKVKKEHNGIMSVAVIGIIVIMLVLILGSMWTGQKTRVDTEEAVRSVSLFYLNELAGRREQVVSSNLNTSINNIRIAIGLMDEEDLRDEKHLQNYQSRMKELYSLDRFAFVDSTGLIYTSQGTVDEIEDYSFDVKDLSKPQISIKNLATNEKKVVIAVPVEPIPFDGKELVICFMEFDVKKMLSGVSLQSDANDTTFCNIYTREGTALTDVVLGGLSSENNLITAMEHAVFEKGYSYEKFLEDFSGGTEGVVSFTYNGIRETLYYVPVDGTEWMLSYLIRESLIGEQISTVTRGIISRSLVQTILATALMLALFGFILIQIRRNAALALEKETTEAEGRVKQQELEQRLALQEKLLEQEKKKVRQENLISALSSDYRSVYYLDLEKNEGICYQPHTEVLNRLEAGEHFQYLETMIRYCSKYVTEPYRTEFMQFVDPDNVRRELAKKDVIAYRYLVNQNGKESYEMIRFAGVRQPGDEKIRTVGACFADVDSETRDSMAKNRALSDALTAAEEANKAKTAFLSNMSHEIRTPMNAIIGLDNIALAEKNIPDNIREYLEKIGASAKHLLSIINDILDMSRIESGRMVLKEEEFSFSKVLEQINTIIGGQCHAKNLHYECRITGKVSDYYIGDDMKLRQIIINILGNAVKFTPEGGSVSFIVEEIAQFGQNATLRFIMQDTGIGMSKEFLPKIFESFSQENNSATNKLGSTGLGMAITKNLVELMNGNISVESEKGVGTTFTVTVTLKHAEKPVDINEVGEPGDLPSHELSVLVIDDDEVACEHAKIVLRQVGITCETAMSGAEGVEMVKMRHARREPYHLILIDWKMPEMDGLETTKRIRSIIGHDSAIIILTSYNWDEIVDDARMAGVDSFVSKPLFAASVMEEFREAFRKRNLIARSGKADLNGRRILLAEDMLVNAEIMVMILNMRGMDVDVAENGKIAVEMFTSHDEGWYDAILMDMRMPVMTGLEATEAIRTCNRRDAKTIPIIALTANAFDEDVQRSLQSGLNAHLSKPVEPEVLYETLESMIAE